MLRHRRLLALLGLTVAGVVLAWVLVDQFATSGPLPERAYGPVNGRFSVSFGAGVRQLADAYTLVTEGDWFLHMTPAAIGFTSALGGQSREEVDVAIYPHAPPAKDVTAYLHWNSTPGGGIRHWQGLPGAFEDQSCHLGDTPTACPGQVADLWIVDGRVVYELRAEQVSESEVERFFDSFRPIGT